MGHRKIKGSASSMPTGLFIGSVISLLVTLVGAAVTAFLVVKERIGENGIGYASMLILFLSTTLGALGAYNKIKKQRLKICLLSGGIYYLLLMAITALFFGGRYQAMGVTGLIILVGSICVAFLPSKNRDKIRIRKHAYR